MSKFCRNCGSALDDNATFCNKCGAKIDSAPGPGPGSVPPYGSNFPPIANNSLSSNEAIFNMGILVAGILVIISTMLPYVTVSFLGYSESISLLFGDGSGLRDGMFFIPLAIAVVVCTFLNQRLPALICGVITFLLCIFEIVSTNATLADSGVSNLVKNGIGFYLIFIASLALAVLSVLAYVNSTNSTKRYPM